jgi:Lrp/AsnC family transcriptional regulator for asnA, asnC and gidA
MATEFSVNGSKLDDLDHQLVDALRMNGRKANSELARELGVTETTVRRRLQRLVEDGYVRIVAVTNPRRIGFQMDVVVALIVDIYQLEAVAARLAELAEVRFVGHVAGKYNLHFVGLFRNAEHFHRFLTETLAALPGIQTVETMQVLKVYKRTYDRVEANGAATA